MSHPNDAASDPVLPIPSPEAARQVVPHSGLDEARRQAMAALDAGARTIAVIGAAGTGKTLLMGELADLLRARQATVHLLRTTHDLLTFRLAQGDSPDLSAAVLLDEADRAGDAELASVLGRGKATGQEGGLRILAGLPPLLRRLEGLGRPATAVTLHPVPREELPGFIAARLDASGYPPDFFTPEAVEELATRSGGVPRLVNVLTAAAAFAASLDNAGQVTARHVVEATRHAAGSAHVVRPAPDPQIFSERPAPQPPAPEESPSADRPHLVDAVARWAGASWLAPGERHPGLTPPDDMPRTAPADEDPPPSGQARAHAPAPAEADPLPPAIPLHPEPPADPARPDEAERPAASSEPAPASLPADELVIPPQPPPVMSAVAPEPAMRAPPPPAEPAEEVISPATDTHEPSIPATPAMAAATTPAAAEPEPAAPRRHGWAYAAAALLVLGGAGIALDRSRDAPAGSPLAHLSPVRAWIEERTGLAPAGRPASTAAVSPSASTAPPAPAAAVPTASPDRPAARPSAPVAGTVEPSAAPRPETAPPFAPAAPMPPATPPGDTARAGSSPVRQPVPSALTPPSQETRQAEAPVPSPAPPQGSATQPSTPPAATSQPPPPQSPAPRPPEPQASTPQASASQDPAGTPAPIPAQGSPVPPAVAAAPPANPPRVMVHVLSRQARGGGGEQALADLAERYSGASILRGGRGPSFPVVRHFFPADAQSAEAIAALLSARGITARVQDFSGFRPQPRPGTVEVWLP